MVVAFVEHLLDVKKHVGIVLAAFTVIGDKEFGGGVDGEIYWWLGGGRRHHSNLNALPCCLLVGRFLSAAVVAGFALGSMVALSALLISSVLVSLSVTALLSFIIHGTLFAAVSTSSSVDN